MNGHLTSLMKDMKSTIQRVKAVEDRMDTSIIASNSSVASSSSRATSRTKTVPLAVRVSVNYLYKPCSTYSSPTIFTSQSLFILQRETRKVYGALMEEDNNFDGWLIAPG